MIVSSRNDDIIALKIHIEDLPEILLPICHRKVYLQVCDLTFSSDNVDYYITDADKYLSSQNKENE